MLRPSSDSLRAYGPGMTTVQPYDDPPAGTDVRFGLHHVLLAIPPGGEDVARSFYLEVLGLTEVAKPAELAARGGLWLRSDALEIHLGVEADFRPARKAHPGVLVADLDALVERLEAAGVVPEWDELFPGMRRCYVDDPHGNRLEFLFRQAGE